MRYVKFITGEAVENDLILSRSWKLVIHSLKVMRKSSPDNSWYWIIWAISGTEGHQLTAYRTLSWLSWSPSSFPPLTLFAVTTLSPLHPSCLSFNFLFIPIIFLSPLLIFLHWSQWSSKKKWVERCTQMEYMYILGYFAYFIYLDVHYCRFEFTNISMWS